MYSDKSYGRSAEVEDIYRLFNAGIDISMPGPRRLGKTFVLDRVVESASEFGWNAIKAEVAGCTTTTDFYQVVCGRIEQKLGGLERTNAWFAQRVGQVLSPHRTSTDSWYKPLTTLDYERYFERLCAFLADDKDKKWALLIDELPIFLKAMHDTGAAGIKQARDFMNLTSRLREDYRELRWLITGSIGLEPLAEEGDYSGVLIKFQRFNLQPLSEDHAIEFVIDLAQTQRLITRTHITEEEAKQLVEAVGWRAAFYLEALTLKLRGEPTDDPDTASRLIEDAIHRLLDPVEMATFGVWEEHLRKHYEERDRIAAQGILSELSQDGQGRRISSLVALSKVNIDERTFRKLIVRLEVDGFISVDDWDAAEPIARFRNPLLRAWWKRFC